MNTVKSLVVFYSRTGTTRQVAEAISDILKCDSEEILDTKNRAGVFGFLSAGWDATFKRLTVIKDMEKDPASYDLVMIGTPIWNFRMSTPIRAYISQNKEHLKKVAFFCTYGGSGSERVLRNMENLCEKRPVALLELNTTQVREEQYIQEIERFADQICNQSGGLGRQSSED